MKHGLNLRDLGGIGGGLVPHGLFLRSGKLSILTPDECAELCKRFNIKCVIDLRTSVEVAEFPDPLPDGVVYLQIPLLKDAAVGITLETGSDPMTIIRNLRKQPEKLKEMVPDFEQLYTDIVTDEYGRKKQNWHCEYGFVEVIWSLVKTAYTSFMVRKELILTAIKEYDK